MVHKFLKFNVRELVINFYELEGLQTGEYRGCSSLDTEVNADVNDFSLF